MELSSIDTSGDAPEKTEWVPALHRASRETIEQLIASEETQDWFLSGVFHHRTDIDDELCQQILRHANCPTRLIAIANRFKPEWVAHVPSMAMVQLAQLDPDGKAEWDKLQKRFAEPELVKFVKERLFENDRLYIDNHRSCDRSRFYDTIEFSRDQYYREQYRQGLMRELILRTPPFILNGFQHDPKAKKVLAAFLPLEVIRAQLADMKAVELEFVAQRNDLPDDLQHTLATNKSVKVRKRLVDNQWTQHSVLMALAKDDNSKIADAALEKLPAHLADEVNKDLVDATLSSNELDINAPLAALRLKGVPEATLIQIAEQSPALYCCAATLHPEATLKVIAAAASRDDLPDWAKIGIALTTDDATLIDQLISSTSHELWLAISDNPHLTKAQAKQLIVASDNEAVWNGIGHQFIDDVELLKLMISRRNKKSLWQTHLKMLLDPKTNANALQKIQRETTPYGILISRLMARHERCPINYLALFAYYLPEDTKLNTKYALKLLEKPESVSAEPYREWKVEDFLIHGYGYAFLYDWVLANHKEPKDIRRCISAYRINPNKVRWLAISEDEDTLRRFIHKEATHFSEYEYRMLATIGNPTTRRNLVKSEKLSDELLIEMLQDADKSVRTQASKLADKRNLTLSTNDQPAQPQSKRQGRLGNKADRLELAEKTSDLEILTILAADKTRDVRRVVVDNEHTPISLLIQLAGDKADSVLISAVYKLSCKKLNAAESERLQNTLKEVLANAERDEKVRVCAAENLLDGEFLASFFVNGTSELDKAIISTTDHQPLLEQALFAAKRNHPSITPELLAENPRLSLEQKLTLPLSARKSTIDKLIKNVVNATELIALYNQHKSVIKAHIEKEEGRLRWSSDHLDATSEEIMQLFAAMEPKPFSLFFENQLQKLNVDDLVAVFSGLLESLDEDGLRRLTCFNRRFSNEQAAALINLFIEQKMWSRLDDLLDLYPQPTETIDLLLQPMFAGVHRALASNQTLNPTQVDILIDSEQKYVKSSLARNQYLTDQQIEILSLASDLEVARCLVSSEKTDIARLPNWTLCKAYDPESWHDNEKVCEELEARGIERYMAIMSLPKTIAHFDLKITARQFNQLLLDTECVEFYETTNWDDKPIKLKRFTKKACQYAHDTEYPSDKFTPQFYPCNFKELLTLMGIEIIEAVPS